MEKKVTVKDVAREAGVSVATVSYIMNDRKDQKISEDTRKKVLQIANLLNYRPSHAAKTLATGKTNIIGVAYLANPSRPSRNMELVNLVHLLIERLNRMNYDVIILSTEPEDHHLPLNGNIDGIIAIDLPEQIFHHLADRYLVPIISVNMLVNDNLFYQIYMDYQARIVQANNQFLAADQNSDVLLVLDRFSNEAYNTHILKSNVPVLFTDQLTPKLLATLKEKKLIVIGHYLGLYLSAYTNPVNMCIISSSDYSMFLPNGASCILFDVDQEANYSINILMNAIDRKFDVKHDCPL